MPTQQVNQPPAREDVQLLADLAANLDDLKNRLPVAQRQQLAFTVAELHDIGETFDAQHSFGIYQLPACVEEAA